MVNNAIAAMFKEDTGSDITDEIIALDIRRDDAITGISLYVDALTRNNVAAVKNNATLVSNAIKLFGSGIARQAMQSETATIISIVTKLTTDTELKAAVAALPLLKDWVDELKASNDLFDAKYLARTVEMGLANPETIKLKRLEAIQKYYELRDMIDSYNIITKGAAPYPSTINSINALIEQYNTVINNRIADAAKKAKGTNDGNTPND
ncbi:unnamed protein product [Rotaria sp. Silwood1]|nr:unnamed protein product [Rotaria sp. Silwood1]CAF4757145.1 unnamed protein product [Rotaria sp. Silwood1]